MSDFKRPYIVLHHSATEDSKSFSWGAIRHYHTHVNGWDDIGYHYGIELVGENYEIVKGRSLLERGAHCKEARMNSRSWGICLVGNFTHQPPPEGQLEACRKLVYELMELSGEVTVSRIIGHREAGLMEGFDWRRQVRGKPQYKDCPGAMFNLDEFRNSL